MDWGPPTLSATASLRDSCPAGQVGPPGKSGNEPFVLSGISGVSTSSTISNVYRIPEISGILDISEICGVCGTVVASAVPEIVEI
jgi:hypothetical protein